MKEVAYYKDAPKDFVIDAPPNFVMHLEVQIFGVLIAMNDGATAPIKGDYFGFALMFDSAEEVTTVFNKLADGGKVINPLASQFWAKLCGDAEDRFGISWHVCTLG